MDANNPTINLGTGQRLLWGIRNLGKTCYLSSLMQSLAACESWNEALRNRKEDPSLNGFISTMHESFEKFRNTSRKESHNPDKWFQEITKLEQCKKWTEYDMQDAGELLNLIVEKLQDEKSKIADVFKGMMQSLTRCDTCDVVIGKDEDTFMWALSMGKWSKTIMENCRWKTKTTEEKSLWL